MMTQSHLMDPDVSQSPALFDIAGSQPLNTMKVLLVGNYEYDGSTSMEIWAEALLRELPQFGIDVKLIAPKPILGRMKPSSSGFGKWLGYFDRFFIFPRALREAASRADVVHICDHGNAMYALRLKDTPVLVTCHDMLAVRGALGELPEMKPSRFGGFLQSWICSGLQAASLVACVSRFTFDDVSRILNQAGNLRVILNVLTYPYQQIPSCEIDTRLANLREIDRPFILHVGSSHRRKNRDGVLRVFAQVAQEIDIKLVFAGDPLSPDHLRIARDLHVENRVVQLLKPDVRTIEALYNRALALLFPSRCEGFGAPPIEAQACGCPVVVSDISPFVEVIGTSGVIRGLNDESGMAESIIRLANDSEYRNSIRHLGIENVRSRFQTARMMREYVSLYRELTEQNGVPPGDLRSFK